MSDSPIKSFKRLIKRIPAIGPALAYARNQSQINNPRSPKIPAAFVGSGPYWESRYRTGGDSGTGSTGRLAEFKAEIINEFIVKEEISSVIEFGCGDGRQLQLARYPKYLGVDVSETVVEQCQKRFSENPTFTFMTLNQYIGEKADVALSLDVIFHLIEDQVFDSYMTTLFNAGKRFVIVYSSNYESTSSEHAPHFRSREFTVWLAAHRPEWQLIRHIPNRYPFNGDGLETSVSDFFVFIKTV